MAIAYLRNFCAFASPSRGPLPGRARNVPTPAVEKWDPRAVRPSGVELGLPACTSDAGGSVVVVTAPFAVVGVSPEAGDFGCTVSSTTSAVSTSSTGIA